MSAKTRTALWRVGRATDSGCYYLHDEEGSLIAKFFGPGIKDVLLASWAPVMLLAIKRAMEELESPDDGSEGCAHEKIQCALEKLSKVYVTIKEEQREASNSQTDE